MGGIALSLPTCFIGVRAMDRALGAPLEKAWSALPAMSLGVLDRIAGASIGSIRLGTSFCASSLRAPAYGVAVPLPAREERQRTGVSASTPPPLCLAINLSSWDLVED